MKTSHSNVAKFKRECRGLFGVHVKFDELDSGMIRVGMRDGERASNLRVPNQPNERFLNLLGKPANDSPTWPRAIGEQFGLKYDGFDEDGNACWFVTANDYREPAQA